MSNPLQNSFTEGPLGRIYVKTALPIIFVMAMNGLLAVADALFLGHYVGPQALAAVTLMFPFYMLIVAFSTLVSGGMSSVLARRLGAADFHEARKVFAGAHGLALTVAIALVLIYLVFGRPLAYQLAGNSPDLADTGLNYLSILTFGAPLSFVLGLNADALRNEGRVGFMAATSLLVSLANILFNYVLIAWLDFGVAGSAYGTLLAQGLAFGVIGTFRLRGQTELRLSALLHHSLFRGWRDILILGAPQSLNFIGLSLGSAATVTALQMVQADGYANTLSAYGIITRILTFTYLPLLGLSHAMQTITGNNFGAGFHLRSDSSLRFALLASLVYCAAVQLILTVWAPGIGAVFVDDPQVIQEVARILPMIVMLFVVSGPLLILGGYFQAIGDALRAALLGLSKPYLFAIPLTFALAQALGETGIWLSGPIAEALLCGLALCVLTQRGRGTALSWGLFQPKPEVTL